MLNAVASLCPGLKVVEFLNKKPLQSDNNFGEEGNVLEPPDVISSELLQSILSINLRLVCLHFFTFHNLFLITFSFRISSQISELILQRISTGHRQVLLSNYGAQLQRLELSHCRNIDLGLLLPCTMLQELFIGYGCDIMPSTVAIQADTFLPRLQKLTSEICLGQSSSLFETTRPLLTYLSLCCSHIGIHMSSNFCCEDIPALWPNMQLLYFYCARGLTLQRFQHIIPHLKHLTVLYLPYHSMQCRSGKSHDIGERLQAELEGEIYLFFEDDWYECIFLDYNNDVQEAIVEEDAGEVIEGAGEIVELD